MIIDPDNTAFQDIHKLMSGSLDNKEEILLDVNMLAKGYEYFAIGGMSVSPDNQWLAYGADTLSRRFYKIYFK